MSECHTAVKGKLQTSELKESAEKKNLVQFEFVAANSQQMLSQGTSQSQ